MTSVYLHIPFCQRKCFYCSFAVSIGQENRMDEYVQALIKEAAIYQGEKIRTIYLGGGTPSLLTVSQLCDLFSFLRRNFSFVDDCEITIEANPENLDLEKSKVLFDLGVNRVSLGVQTFNDGYLKSLGRAHDSFKALSAFNDLRRAGFKNINVDLMYSFPKQTLEEIKQDVQTLLGLGSEHVSIYTLTVEPNSKFYVQKILEQDNENQAAQYQLVTLLLQESGLLQYEVSNFSRSGFESKHNINYWESGNYIGLGMSAHSHHDGRRSWNTDRFAQYLKNVESNQSPQEGQEILSGEKRLREALVFGLRMNKGVIVSEIEKKIGGIFSEKQHMLIDALIQNRLLCYKDRILQTTARGQLMLDMVSVYLI